MHLPKLKESTSLPECHSPSTFAETTVLLEKVSPQKSICSEYTCTLTDTDTDTDHDELYMPSAESKTETENESDVEIEKIPVEQKKFVVFEKNLGELFVTCSTCAKPIVEQSKKCIGSMVVVQAVCVDGHQNKWRSQPMIGEKIAGNLLLAGSILFSGNTFQNVNSLAQCLNLAFIGEVHFMICRRRFFFL